MKNMEGGIAIPRLDGTGPVGLGPRTGRKRGYCVSSSKGYELPILGNKIKGHPYIIPAVSLLYRFGKRYVLPRFIAGTGRRWGRRFLIKFNMEGI